ncbi:type I restriction enzyme HsdR N-terminal domain-containing protein [Calidifontibacillus oryziterrae]|uniref:type I restriction enzyme HsdR N-terminal domain-containing protein n=1 Tax=Calidifontibacillus oryziterrae TaxID=1191699 RepID=UPI00031CC932|nr:type I restriction enzyme HsdR N-terminal domain-containing protein [Calidifontibacillus oryziterrae]
MTRASNLKTFIRDGQECIMCKVRKKLIVLTPEEEVRQSTIEFLTSQMNVPLDKIEIEVPMSYFKKGAKGRADIIVSGIDEDGYLVAVLIVECKAPTIPLTDDVFEQAVSYDNIVLADTILLTNGNKKEFEHWVESEKRYCPLTDTPTYLELIDKKKLKYDLVPKEPWKRPDFKKIRSKMVIDEFLHNGWLGEDTEMELQPFIVNLGGFFQDDQVRLSPCDLSGVNIVEDGGIRFTSFGNAAGGSWHGYYRFFVLQDEQGNHQVISIGTFAQMKATNHPKFGNSKGYTILVVAIDDYDSSHNSLQLNLDKNLIVHGNEYTITHDGRLTVGNKGAVKREDVVNFLREMAPDLVQDDRIVLGKFDNSKEITIKQANTKQFLGRLIKYALIRDKYRKLCMKK